MLHLKFERVDLSQEVLVLRLCLKFESLCFSKFLVLQLSLEFERVVFSHEFLNLLFLFFFFSHEFLDPLVRLFKLRVFINNGSGVV